jgi:hypothetical protein
VKRAGEEKRAMEAVMGAGCREEQRRLLWELVVEKSRAMEAVMMRCYGCYDER